MSPRCAGCCPATRFAVDAYVRFVREKTPARSDRLVAHRAVLAADHRRAGRGHAGELRLRHPRDARLFRQAAAAGRSATPTSRWTMSSATPARPSSSSRCWRRSSSNAACCGRCSTRCITPMSSPRKSRPAPSCRRVISSRGCGARLLCHLLFGEDSAKRATRSNG